MRGRGLPEGWPRPTKVAPFFDWRVPGPFVQPRATICPLPSLATVVLRPLHLSSPAILKEQTRRTRARRKRALLTHVAYLPSHLHTAYIRPDFSSLVPSVKEFTLNSRSSNLQFPIENSVFLRVICRPIICKGSSSSAHEHNENV